MNKNRLSFLFVFLSSTLRLFLGRRSTAPKPTLSSPKRIIIQPFPCTRISSRKIQKPVGHVLAGICYLGLNNDENAAPFLEPLTVVVDSLD